MQNNSQEFVRFSGDVAHLLFEEHGYTPAESFAAMNDARVATGFQEQISAVEIATAISKDRN